MNCSLKKCYFCLEQTGNLTNIDNSSSINTELVRALMYFGFNVFWVNRPITICETCSLRSRESFEFVTMCYKNNIIVQGYLKLSTNEQQNSVIEAQFAMQFDDSPVATCPIKLENPEGDESVQYESITKCSENVPVNETVTVATKEQSQVKPKERIDNEFEEILINEYHSEVDIKEEFLSGPEGSEEECSTNNSTDTPEISANDCERASNNIAACSINENLNIAKRKEGNVFEGVFIQKRYACTICSMRFAEKARLVRHVRVHTGERPFKCSICTKGYTTKSALKYHTAYHGDRLFVCSMCPKRFVHKDHLAKHMCIHTEELPYKCSTCNKGFRRKSCLCRHIQIHTGDKQFECSICNKRFIHSSYLSSHLRIHSDDKPYKCPTCNKYFHKKLSLDYHVQVHTGEKQYKCEHCNKYFRNKSNLTAHVRTHTGEKPFKCENCNKFFSHKSSLNKHMRRHSYE